MGGTWHLKTFEAPEVPTGIRDRMAFVGMQLETKGLLGIRRSRTAGPHRACIHLASPRRRLACSAGHHYRPNRGPIGLLEPALLQASPLLGSTCHCKRVGLCRS